MRSHYHSVRKKRQRAQKRAKLHEYYRENLFDMYTSNSRDDILYRIEVRDAFNAAAAPEKPAPRLPQDGLWLTDDDMSAKNFKKVSAQIAQKEKVEQYAARPIRRGFGTRA